MIVPRSDHQLVDVLLTALLTACEGVMVTDAAQSIVFVNDAVLAMTGFEEAEMLGRNPRFLQADGADRATVAEMKAALDAGQRFRGLVLNRRKDGREFWNDMTITPIRDAQNAITHFFGVQRDSTEVAALREDLRLQLDRAKREAETAQLLLRVARMLSDHSSFTDVTEVIALGILDICGCDRSAVALWDAAADRLSVAAHSGFPAHLADKVSAFSVLSADLPELAGIVELGRPIYVAAGASAPMMQLLEEFEETAFVAMPISSRGEFRGVLLAYWVGTPPPNMDVALDERLEGLSHLAAVALENASLLDQAVWNGTHDTLTGLADRTLFEQYLHERLAIAATSSESVAVMYFDIDHFKRINDTLGHNVGDEVLRRFGNILLGVTRSSDIVARIGGDEFVIVLIHDDAQHVAEAIAGRIRAHLEAPLSIRDQDLSVSVSIGIGVSDTLDSQLSVAQQVEALTVTADAAMYRDKAARSGDS